MTVVPRNPFVRSVRAQTVLLAGVLLLGAIGTVRATTVYRWVDEHGVIHITSEKPPSSVKAERLEMPTSTKRGGATAGSSGGAKSAPVSPVRAAEREEVLDSLRNRECVVALEALERKTSATEPTSAAELRRLQQTADANCSSNPAQRREQEDMAARLRVANGPTCVEARSRLGEMLESAAGRSQGDVRAQQQFVDDYCTSPIR
jgi:hypothetical protein